MLCVNILQTSYLNFTPTKVDYLIKKFTSSLYMIPDTVENEKASNHKYLILWYNSQK